MRRRAAVLLMSVGVVVATISTGSAASRPQVPARPSIVDLANDANIANDQGAEYFTRDQGDHAAPVNVDSRGDILAVWFTSRASVVAAHVQTVARPAGSTTAYGFRIQMNPTAEQPSGCTFFEAIVAGPTWHGGATKTRVRDICLRAPGAEPFADGTVTIHDGPDGTSILTMQFRVGSAPMIEPCDVLVRPRANTRYVVGATTFAMLPQIDNTKPGSDYRLQPAGRAGARCR